MIKEKMGGRAFPVPEAFDSLGMTLWDYYAAHCPSENVKFHDVQFAADFAGLPLPDEQDVPAMVEFALKVGAAFAARYADAMLEERRKRRESDK